mmetsp:Transcript_54266/g.156880  ORF Transcript_54266/g.156880 Transcript_54266/m.156880 type:complete len:406 (-) Transcript_54266:78-1295(-)
MATTMAPSVPQKGDRPAAGGGAGDYVASMPRLSVETYLALLAAAKKSPPPYIAPAPRRGAKTTPPAPPPEKEDPDTSSGSEASDTASDGGFEQDGWVTVAARGRKAPRPTPAKPVQAALPKAGPPARPARPATGPLIHHQLPVTLDDSLQSRAVRKLLGQGGENIKRITSMCPGTWVELRGAGTNLGRGTDTGPLVLHVKGHDADVCKKAVELATSLIDETLEVMGKHQAAEPGVSADAAPGPPSGGGGGGGGGGGASSAARSGAPARPQRPESAFVHRELAVGLEDTPEFRVARRLIGQGGEHVKFIAQECPGTRLELRGEGANPWNGPQSGPLVLHIRARDAATADAAVKLAEELLEHVKEERAAALAGYAESGEGKGGKGGKGRGKGKASSRPFHTAAAGES